MAEVKQKITTLEQLNKGLKIGEFYIVEFTGCCHEYPDIPMRVWHEKREKLSDTTFRVVPWD